MTPRKAPEAVLVALAEAACKLTFSEGSSMEKACTAYRTAVAPLRTSDDWRPSNADPVCDPKLAKRETLEALAVALDGTWSKGEPDGGGAVKGALDAYRTECRPAPLRTRAEVDAEMVRVVRTSITRGLGVACSTIDELARLCSEPTADETVEHDENGDPIPTMYKDCGKCRYPSAGVCCGDEWCIRHHCCGHERGDT